MTPQQRKLSEDTNADLLNKLRALKMEIMPVPDKRPFQEKMQPIYKEFEGKIGRDLIQAVQQGQ